MLKYITIPSLKHSRLLLLVISCVFLSCGLNDEDSIFGPISQDSFEEVKSPQYLIQASNNVTAKIEDMRRTRALRALSKMDGLLSTKEFARNGYYIRFLKRRLEVLKQFMKGEVGVSGINAALYNIVEVDSLLMEANLKPLSVSFYDDGSFNVFETEKPIVIEYFFFDQGENKGVIFEIDSIKVTDLEGGGKFLSYEEKLQVDSQVEYVYTIGIELGMNPTSNYAIKQSYRFNTSSLSFKLENRDDNVVTGYSLSEDSDILINSSIESTKNEDNELTEGNLIVSVGDIEIVGDLSNVRQLLEDLKLGEKERSNFTTASNDIEEAFVTRTNLIARYKFDTEQKVADVTLKSKVQGDGIVTGYSILYPDSDVIFLPDHLKDILDKVDQDFALFNIILR